MVSPKCAWHCTFVSLWMDISVEIIVNTHTNTTPPTPTKKKSPFFIHPLFREGGHFMLVSQFQSPNYFLLAFLEDYRADPARAQPLLTISVFEDMADSKGVALVRCDVINRGIDEDEGLGICKSLLNDYADEEDFRIVHTFNKMPDAFDLDAFVREKERRWKA